MAADPPEDSFRDTTAGTLPPEMKGDQVASPFPEPVAREELEDVRQQPQNIRRKRPSRFDQRPRVDPLQDNLNVFNNMETDVSVELGSQAQMVSGEPSDILEKLPSQALQAQMIRGSQMIRGEPSDILEKLPSQALQPQMIPGEPSQRRFKQSEEPLVDPFGFCSAYDLVSADRIMRKGSHNPDLPGEGALIDQVEDLGEKASDIDQQAKEIIENVDLARWEIGASTSETIPSYFKLDKDPFRDLPTHELFGAGVLNLNKPPVMSNGPDWTNVTMKSFERTPETYDQALKIIGDPSNFVGRNPSDDRNTNIGEPHKEVYSAEELSRNTPEFLDAMKMFYQGRRSKESEENLVDPFGFCSAYDLVSADRIARKGPRKPDLPGERALIDQVEDLEEKTSDIYQQAKEITENVDLARWGIGASTSESILSSFKLDKDPFWDLPTHELLGVGVLNLNKPPVKSNGPDWTNVVMKSSKRTPEIYSQALTIIEDLSNFVAAGLHPEDIIVKGRNPSDDHDTNNIGEGPKEVYSAEELSRNTPGFPDVMETTYQGRNTGERSTSTDTAKPSTSSQAVFTGPDNTNVDTSGEPFSDLPIYAFLPAVRKMKEIDPSLNMNGPDVVGPLVESVGQIGLDNYLKEAQEIIRNNPSYKHGEDPLELESFYFTESNTDETSMSSQGVIAETDNTNADPFSDQPVCAFFPDVREMKEVNPSLNINGSEVVGALVESVDQRGLDNYLKEAQEIIRNNPSYKHEEEDPLELESFYHTESVTGEGSATNDTAVASTSQGDCSRQDIIAMKAKLTENLLSYLPPILSLFPAYREMKEVDPSLEMSGPELAAQLIDLAAIKGQDKILREAQDIRRNNQDFDFRDEDPMDLNPFFQEKIDSSKQKEPEPPQTFTTLWKPRRLPPGPHKIIRATSEYRKPPGSINTDTIQTKSQGIREEAGGLDILASICERLDANNINSSINVDQGPSGIDPTLQSEIPGNEAPYLQTPENEEPYSQIENEALDSRIPENEAPYSQIPENQSSAIPDKDAPEVPDFRRTQETSEVPKRGRKRKAQTRGCPGEKLMRLEEEGSYEDKGARLSMREKCITKCIAEGSEEGARAAKKDGKAEKVAKVAKEAAKVAIKGRKRKTPPIQRKKKKSTPKEKPSGGSSQQTPEKGAPLKPQNMKKSTSKRQPADETQSTISGSEGLSEVIQKRGLKRKAQPAPIDFKERYKEWETRKLRLSDRLKRVHLGDPKDQEPEDRNM